MKHGPICDFCMSPDVRWTHPPKDDSPETVNAGAEPLLPPLPLKVVYNASGWAACETCSDLATRGDIENLASRAARLGLAQMGLTPSRREVRQYGGVLAAKYRAVLPVLGPRRSPNDDDLESFEKGFKVEPVEDR